jgi:hypothetical protein
MYSSPCPCWWIRGSSFSSSCRNPTIFSFLSASPSGGDTYMETSPPFSINLTWRLTTRERRCEKRAERLIAFFKPTTTVAPVESSIKSKEAMAWRMRVRWIEVVWCGMVWSGLKWYRSSCCVGGVLNRNERSRTAHSRLQQVKVRETRVYWPSGGVRHGGERTTK